MAVRTSPTGFVNLQRYLQGAEGLGQQMVGAITGGVGAQEQADIKKQGEAASQTIAGAGQSAIQKGQDIQKGLQSDASQALGGAKDYLAQQYQNPDVGTQIGAIKASEASAKEKAGSLESAPTQEAALKTAYGKAGPYSSGFAALDQFLIGADPQARQALQQKTEALKSQASLASKSAIDQIQAQQQKTAADVKKQKQNITDQAAKDYWNKVNYAQAGINQMNKPTPDLYKYIKGTQKGASLADVMSEADLADLKALSNISGTTWNPEQEQKQFTKGLVRKVVPKAGEKFRG